MRALGTDPIQKLVTPRLIAMAVVLPLLTIIADFLGLVGGYFIASTMLNITTSQYWSTAWRILEYNDLTQGLLKPFLFAIVIALVGCYYGMNTTGGTQGGPLHHQGGGCGFGLDLHHHVHAGPALRKNCEPGEPTMTPDESPAVPSGASAAGDSGGPLSGRTAPAEPLQAGSHFRLFSSRTSASPSAKPTPWTMFLFR